MTVRQVVARLLVLLRCRSLAQVRDVELFDRDDTVPIHNHSGLLMVEVVASVADSRADRRGFHYPRDRAMDHGFDIADLGKPNALLPHAESGGLSVGETVVASSAFGAWRTRTLFHYTVDYFETTLFFAQLIVMQTLEVGLIGEIDTSTNILKHQRVNTAEFGMALFPDRQSILLVLIGEGCAKEFVIVLTPVETGVIDLPTRIQHLLQETLLRCGWVEPVLVGSSCLDHPPIIPDKRTV